MSADFNSIIIPTFQMGLPGGSDGKVSACNAGAAAAAAELLQSCPTLCDPIDGSPPGSVAAAELLQSCPTLCDPIDSSPPGSSVHGTLQAGILEWVAISFSNA